MNELFFEKLYQSIEDKYYNSPPYIQDFQTFPEFLEKEVEKICKALTELEQNNQKLSELLRHTHCVYQDDQELSCSPPL